MANLNFKLCPEFATFLKEPIGTVKISSYIMSMDKTLYLALLDALGILMHKSTMFSKQSLIRLYKLEMKGFVQDGQAFFLCFATDLPSISKFQFVLIIDVAQTKLN